MYHQWYEISCATLYILLANHWYDCFPINTLIHLFLPFFFDVLTLDVKTHSLSKMLVTNQVTCSSAEEQRSHLLWFTLILVHSIYIYTVIYL